jgi:hypothetical protein
LLLKRGTLALSIQFRRVSRLGTGEINAGIVVKTSWSSVASLEFVSLTLFAIYPNMTAMPGIWERVERELNTYFFPLSHISESYLAMSCRAFLTESVGISANNAAISQSAAFSIFIVLP